MFQKEEHMERNFFKNVVVGVFAGVGIYFVVESWIRRLVKEEIQKEFESGKSGESFESYDEEDEWDDEELDNCENQEK